MKKSLSIIFVSFLLLFPANGLKAETVSAYQAEKIAQSFVSANNLTKASAPKVKLVWNGSDKTMKDAPFYVFNSDNSFVIVAGNDSANPILGYSTSGVFDESNIPDGLKLLLENHSKSFNSNPASNKNTAVSSYLNGTKSAVATQSVVDLATARWGQSSPFNDNCPLLQGSRCVTGCAATSLAILMKHYGFPNQAYGPLPEYTTGTNAITIAAKTIDYQYQWDQMTDTYGSSSTVAQKSAVATLMADLGQILKMDYGTSGSSAKNSAILPAMFTYMKYSNSAAMIYRSNYTSQRWSQTLKDELDANHPVLYLGSSVVGGGHAYIVDGYDSDGRFHFNWGWGGNSNGFFFFPDTYYSNGESAITGLVPDYNWAAPTSSSSLSYYVNSDNGNFGIWADNPYIESGSNVSIHISVINNATVSYSNGAILVAIRHSDNTVDGLNGGLLPALDPNYRVSFSLSVDIPTVSTGDEIVAYYRDSNNNWIPLDGTVSIPLRYNIEDVLSLNYSFDGVDKVLKIKGMTGMTVTVPSSSPTTFSTPLLSLTNPSSGNYTFSNGHAQYTVNLAF